MNILVLQEKHAEERRVAVVPDHVPALVKGGNSVLVESGAGALSGYEDRAYREKGAQIITDRRGALKEADVLVAVRLGAADESDGVDVNLLKEGAVVIAMMDPWKKHPAFDAMKARKISAFALELIPRTTRAQSMDVLSSMANLAGYKGVLFAAELLPKLFPMMMTAAGTITPAKVFVLGAGVAGLQAIATAKRLGAVVSAYDVRPAVQEQVESLGAEFIAFDVGSAEGTGGYAAELTSEQKQKQQELMIDYVGGVDIVITTAAVPGKPSPKLISEEMVKKMAPGSVIVDLASERGGNCEVTTPGEKKVVHGVTVYGPVNVPSTVAHTASQLYSKNCTSFLNLLRTEEGELHITPEDDIVAGCMICHRGEPGNEGATEALGFKETS
ncbi:Re/Si-specific NAD(P)(+) transhydrogenase subunit alpha [Chitinivibrio alkaliphilus]|uniref:proton-translocating NAD(P)(+) transhydrogenase n=1 Tax=Chitinivibrio alkaliphilus ACht1 TaxID=1313304 RepID=U7D7X1_9BACT|nr:Re/Si-specific NAD(P)(+) transhydrogenase subunit alpha [Chitinivibrio alkaliphilus]ERP39050.1 NAD(P) transhydrogenase subunit alpha part 1 [Chitinivibrio alkaliphilus ACht1]